MVPGTCMFIPSRYATTEVRQNRISSRSFYISEYQAQGCVAEPFLYEYDTTYDRTIYCMRLLVPESRRSDRQTDQLTYRLIRTHRRLGELHREHGVVLWVPLPEATPFHLREWIAAPIGSYEHQRRRVSNLSFVTRGLPAHHSQVVTQTVAQQPPPAAAVEPPISYRKKLYSTAAFQAGEPLPATFLVSYRFTEVPGWGERPTPTALREQTFSFSERRPMTF